MRGIGHSSGVGAMPACKKAADRVGRVLVPLAAALKCLYEPTDLARAEMELIELNEAFARTGMTLPSRYGADACNRNYLEDADAGHHLPHVDLA
jgi:hypothetical protein